MKIKFQPMNWILVVLISFMFLSGSDDDIVITPVPMVELNIVELAIANESLTQLETAVIKTDLVGTLSGVGPFTVFAPTDDAFVALLDALGSNYNSLDDFDTEGEIALLKNILLFHVVPDEVNADDLAAVDIVTAFTDNDIAIIASGDTFVLGDTSETDAGLLPPILEQTTA